MMAKMDSGSVNNNNIKNDHQLVILTVSVLEVPKEMRNPAIHRGYRLTDQPWSYYIKSMFYLNNETINIWTHLLGFVIMVFETGYYYNIYKSHDSSLQWTVLGFGTCCCMTLFNSATAHLLHSKSPYVNYVIFMFDYIGVVFWGYGTAFLAYYGVSTKEMYDLIGPTYMPFHLLFTYLNFLNICNTKLKFGHDPGNSRRKQMMVSGVLIEAIFTLIPWGPRYYNCFLAEDCSLSSLNHITIVVLSFTFMTLTFVLHQPEKWYPGSFDLIGQSHQIFHVFVLLTQSLQLRALYIDFLSGVNAHCHPDIYITMLYIFILYSICVLTIVCLRPRIIRALENNKKKA